MSGENYLKSAYAYLYIRDFERAAEAFQRAIESEPENPEYYFHASVTALRNECYNLALEWSARAHELAPDNALYQEHHQVVIASQLTREGQALLLEGNDTAALVRFEQALKHDPLNQDAIIAYQRLAPFCTRPDTSWTAPTADADSASPS